MVSKDLAFKHDTSGDLLPGWRSNDAGYIISLSEHMHVKYMFKNTLQSWTQYCVVQRILNSSRPP